jgi:hypothetical protein
MSWERELKVLAEAIRRLNAEYDAFLFGSVAKPPVESRKHVEEMFRRLTQSQSDSAADRYQLNSLQGRFSSLCERWERLQAEKESGRRPGIHASFKGSAGESASPHPNAASLSSVQADRGDAGAGDRDLFERYVAAKRGRGEEVAGLGFEAFRARLVEEREKLRQKVGGAEVEFDVVEREGRVKVVARAPSPGSAVKRPK